jgi:hypothetical protein
MGFKPIAIFVLGVSLRAGLCAYTAQALTAPSLYHALSRYPLLPLTQKITFFFV